MKHFLPIKLLARAPASAHKHKLSHAEVLACLKHFLLTTLLACAPASAHQHKLTYAEVLAYLMLFLPSKLISTEHTGQHQHTTHSHSQVLAYLKQLNPPKSKHTHQHQHARSHTQVLICLKQLLQWEGQPRSLDALKAAVDRVSGISLWICRAVLPNSSTCLKQVAVALGSFQHSSYCHPLQAAAAVGRAAPQPGHTEGSGGPGE